MKLLVLALFFSSLGFAKNIAKVKMLRGEAFYKIEGQERAALQKDDWLKEGAVVETSAKSFVRLSFIDDSKVNIGPKSIVRVEQFKDDKPGVLSVVTGKIRAEVSKDYLKMKKNKSKLFVKSNHAVMGIRGTDFVFSSNRKSGNTTAVLFEGSVVFNKLKKEDRKNYAKFESVVNKGFKIKPGEFSVVNKNREKPSRPIKLNPKQFNKMYQNKNFTAEKGKALKDATPRGLNKKVVELEKSDTGSMIHIGSGSIVTTDALDKARIDSAGEYIPPKGIVIDDSGEVFQKVGEKLNKIDKGSDGKIVIDDKNGNISAVASSNNNQNQSQINTIPQPVGESFRPDTFRRGRPSHAPRPPLPGRRRIIINTQPTDLP